MVASRRSATYLRVDEIEQAMRSLSAFEGERGIGPAGYIVSYALASSNLAIGQWVVADCVNPVRESRMAWRAVALRAGKPLLEVEIACSNQTEHRRRVEARGTDIAGLVLPTWQDVQAMPYEAWPEPHLVLDTAVLDPAEALEVIEQEITRHL